MELAERTQALVGQILVTEDEYQHILTNQSIQDIMFLLNGYSMYLYHKPFCGPFVKRGLGPVDVEVQKLLEEGVDYDEIQNYLQDEYTLTLANLLDSLVQYTDTELTRLVHDQRPDDYVYSPQDAFDMFIKDFDLEQTVNSLEDNDSNNSNSDNDSDDGSTSSDDTGGTDSDSDSSSDDTGSSSSSDDTGSSSSSDDTGDTDGGTNESGDSDSDTNNTGDTTSTAGSSDDANHHDIPNDLEDDLL